MLFVYVGMSTYKHFWRHDKRLDHWPHTFYCCKKNSVKRKFHFAFQTELWRLTLCICDMNQVILPSEFLKCQLKKGKGGGELLTSIRMTKSS